MELHLEQFMKDNPELSLVMEQDDKTISLLLWAQKKRYILLTAAPTGELCFTKEDLEKAKMWREKDET